MGTCVLFVYTCKSACSCVYLAVLTYCLAICLFPMCWFFSYMYTYWINDFWFLSKTPMHCLCIVFQLLWITDMWIPYEMKANIFCSHTLLINNEYLCINEYNGMYILTIRLCTESPRPYYKTHFIAQRYKQFIICPPVCWSTFWKSSWKW